MSYTYFFQRHPRAAFLFFFCALLLIPGTVEFALWFFLHHPAPAKHFPYLYRAVAHNYYLHELDLIQYQPQCAEYDNQLFYVMKPGACRHRSVEFDCTYFFNSMGLRDDEVSLQKPEIIVLGDSYAMGWGMDNEKIFSSLVEHATGMKTLNVSCSSYGTAREFMLLNRLDLSNLKYLIIQYCTNDFEENRQFVDGGFRLKIHSREFYEAAVRNHAARIKYFPFLYSYTVLKTAWHRLFPHPASEHPQQMTLQASLHTDFRTSHSPGNKFPPSFTPEDSVRYFLEILKSKPELERAEIITLNISGPFYTTPSFIRTLSEIKIQQTYPHHIRSMKAVDICGFVNRDDYYVLDCHLNEKGHRKIAHMLIAALKSD